MIVEQLSIFENEIPTFKIDRPIELVEFFAGTGSQVLALKRQNFQIAHTTIVEWWTQAFKSYKLLNTDDNTDYAKDKTKDELVEFLFNKSISSDSGSPMKRVQIERKSLEWLKETYNNIIATNNLVDITKVRESDLRAKNSNNITLWTYSFPCQDLSLAGKGRGMNKDSGTRSGLLWEIERLLRERERERERESGSTLPTILLMENVPQVVGTKHIRDFRKWDLFLRNLGYTNYTELLNSKDYGIPQTRNRAFMLSIHGNYFYKFPIKQKLELNLKDMLEPEVDEKYFLSDKRIESIKGWNAYEKPLEKMEMIEKTQICQTITTRTGDFTSSMILVREKTKKGYAIAEVGDGIYLDRPHQKRGVVQKGMIPIIKTQSKDIGVVVGTYQYGKSDNFMKGKDRFQPGKEIADTIDTNPKEGVVLESEDGECRIRRLTPREIWRLMGFTDDEFSKVQSLSNSTLGKIAGNSIVVNVLENIFKMLK